MRTGLKAAVQSLAGVVFFGLLLFLPAGTFGYWQAWVFIGCFMLSTAGPAVYLLVKDPATIERRMKAGQETRPLQRLLVVLLFFLFPALLVFCAFDHRFGWSPVPTGVALFGDALVAGGMVFAMVVVLQNRYASANITVDTEQKVVSTGLYGFVRHPMYTGSLIMTIGLPLALDSWWGLVGVVPVAAILAVRVIDEETVLEHELDGYHDYMGKTRFRLMPYVW